VFCCTRFFLRRGTAPHDLHDGVLGEPDIAADQAVGQTVAVHCEYLPRLLVGGTLAHLAAENDASGLGGGQP